MIGELAGVLAAADSRSIERSSFFFLSLTFRRPLKLSMSQDEVAAEVYKFIKASTSFEADKAAFHILLQRYATAKPSGAAAVPGDVLASLQGPVVAARTLEAVELSGNAALRYDVAWATLTPAAAHFFENNGFQRVAMALRSLCTDDIARTALKGITKIAMKHSDASEGTVNVDTAAHTLELTGNYGVLSSSPSDNAIRVALDNALKITFHRMMARVREQLLVREKEILTELGAKVHMNVELDTFTTVASLEFLDNVGGLRVLMALRSCAADATAKAMVAAAIKTITFRNVTNENDYAVRFSPATGEIFLACQFDRLTSTGNILSYAQIYEELMRHLNVRVAQKTKELKEKQLPEREAELKEILNVPVPYVVEFGSFQNENELNFVDNVCCHRVSMACRCVGDKTTLAKNLKSVRIVNVKTEAEKSLSYANGVLELHCAFGSGLSGAFSDGEIRAALTK